ncbi:phytoene dehydrogenase-like isoform X1 [Panicum virgatum]|uniref:Amine oxidase domain-containing protein n=1 Tax=Panicum virgatum TaxID=38727 RepID=A0A8T0QG98_PANVG|nr:phytoene dehydrogenase-like isoform X1 [Panicum virgatum]XP_039773472.1 phytoene dehydrogenase-like isoform X1 [Panicum virgatum]XP_039773473.1 phytoene dehydrogenase-like isoform X1 [Panicum virgatum]XP_039773474.1 phytoene dehydrogenase-like isoform X1 [Panicum virgatum]XP_039773477.1 phytoene dehydrogenase-like isoform X1 [Panicum virgatum]XP_039773478.1 phytoene dehydrogenase-like isoform X1 [Panicum virgatum]XP_039773479.1 phytoene dehydrogenase-like isoform X1 [Panicum virgatum]XP_0
MCGCSALVAGGRPPPSSIPLRLRRRRGSSVRAEVSPGGESERKKVAVAGAGWAGLAAAHHLVKQGYDVTLLAAENGPTEEVGLRGFWHPYRNIFALVDELGISPFTGWNKAAYYSPEGLTVEFPIFHNQPRLPAPFGVFAYPEFPNLPLIDRLTSIPVIAAVIDFDNTDTAWRKYDSMTARELFKMYGCSQRLYREVFEPAIQAALFAPGEQCSAAATLGMLYYYMLSHQENSDFLLCRGDVEGKFFSPWLQSLEMEGLKFVPNKVPSSLTIDTDSGCISAIVCGDEIYKADAFVSAMGLSSLQSIVKNSPFLWSHREFANLLHLSTVDVISIKLWLDKKITIPNVANVCPGFDDSSGWTFFDLTSIYDDYYEEPMTVVEVEFYNASRLITLSDDDIVSEASLHLIKCIQDFEGATVIQKSVKRSPKSVINFLPGSYKYTPRGSTSFPNLFIAGDWIVNRHGSFSKEKAYVTGLEAANRMVDYFGTGDFAKIIAVEGDEPHIETLRSLSRRANELKSQIPFSEFFLQ